jgi:hypothetical protein
MQTDSDDAYETLMQFLYRAPVALMQLRRDGEIEMLNPMASQLLMPLAPDGDLTNLFKVLQAHAPDLAHPAVRRRRQGTIGTVAWPAEGGRAARDGGAARRDA